jgi:hypothetical protein
MLTLLIKINNQIKLWKQFLSIQPRVSSAASGKTPDQVVIRNGLTIYGASSKLTYLALKEINNILSQIKKVICILFLLSFCKKWLNLII